MEAIFKNLFTFIMISGSIYLFANEIRAYLQYRKSPEEMSDNNVKIRVLRRLLGSFIVIVASGMMFWGMNFMARPTRALYQIQAIYWTTVIGLVFLSVIFAIWDILDVVRSFDKSLEKSSKEQIENIKRILKEQENAEEQTPEK